MRESKTKEIDSDNPQSTPDFDTEEQRSSHYAKMKAASQASAVVVTFTGTPSPPADQNAEAGPSRPRRDSDSSSQKDPIHEDILQNFAQHSQLSPSILPRSRVRGSVRLATDFFCGSELTDIDDPELFPMLPLLGPPPQPSGPEENIFWEGRMYWGVFFEARYFFSDHSEAVYSDDEEIEGPTYIKGDPKVQANVEKYHKLKHEGVHFNEVLMKNRSFKNPHVYSQLVDFLGIDETRSNLPCLDTGRAKGGWRAKFPLSEKELVEGDPIRTSERQQQEHVDRQMEKLKAGHKRKIEFGRGQYDHSSVGNSNGHQPQVSHAAGKKRAYESGNGGGSAANHRPSTAAPHRNSGQSASNSHTRWR